MTIEVFFCQIECRSYSDCCKIQWQCMPEVKLIELRPGTMSMDLSFQMTRRIYAEANATGDWYVLADDDCFIWPNVVLEAWERLQDHDECKFGMISLEPWPAIIHPWHPKGYGDRYQDSLIYEHVSVGGVRFIRKWVMKSWPMMVDFSPPQYDRIHCDAMRDAGYRCGYFRDLKCAHLGEKQLLTPKP